MSYILDALQKAEKERERQAALNQQQTVKLVRANRPPTKSMMQSPWPWVSAAIVVGALAGAWAYVHSDDVPAPMSSASIKIGRAHV